MSDDMIPGPAGAETVLHLSTTVVKGTQMAQPRAVEIGPGGIVGDRRFLLVDDADRTIEGAGKAPFLALSFEWDRESETLTLHLPDGTAITDSAEGSGQSVEVDHFGLRTLRCQEVRGRWSELLSERTGTRVRLLRLDEDHDAFDIMPITLVSEASLRRAAEAAGSAEVDHRRLRGALVLGGLEAHEEETWEGRVLAIGDVRLLVRTPVPRCMVTSLNPGTGERDLNLPRAVAGYRSSVGVPDGLLPGFLGPPLAVYAEVLSPGRIEVGMPYRVEDTPRRKAEAAAPSTLAAGPVDLELRVASRAVVADDVALLELVDHEGRELPSWSPGAHVELRLGNGVVRHYSLCGDPADRASWRIGVLRVPTSRGGSAFVHDELVEGSVVAARGPRNNFELVPARGYVFIAGGIGITPMLPMIAAAQAAGAQWSLHYGGRSRSSMAFVDELSQAHPDAVAIHARDESGRMDLEGVLAAAPPGTLVYCCGPETLLAAVEDACASWPPGSVHLERFTAMGKAFRDDDTAFAVRLARTGRTLTVPPGRTIVEVLDAEGVALLSSCREGTCGTCETTVLSGAVDHRDALLTRAERESATVMFPCVSRAAGPELVLDL